MNMTVVPIRTLETSPEIKGASQRDSLPERSQASRPAPQGLRGLKPTRRGRIVLAFLVILAIAAIVLLVARPAMAEGTASATTPVTVAQGDTLWSLASDVARPGEDLRDIVIEIKELNDLPTGYISVGQLLLLPIHS